MNTDKKMRIIPGVRQDSFGKLYRIAQEENGPAQSMVPYEPVRTIEYVPGSMAKMTDHFIVTELDGSQHRL